MPDTIGQYYAGANDKTQTFNLNFAFDSLDEVHLRKLRQVFGGDDISELIFDETPYKAYSVKVSGVPQIRSICFMENGKRVYKGEGTVTFIAYFPYAHSPSKLWHKDAEGSYYLTEVDGRILSNYDIGAYPNREEWEVASGLTDLTGTNVGDLPAPFIVERAAGTVTVAGHSITIEEGKVGTWNSENGTVSDENNQLIGYEGNGVAAIPVGAQASVVTTEPSGPVLHYKYWYY